MDTTTVADPCKILKIGAVISATGCGEYTRSYPSSHRHSDNKKMRGFFSASTVEHEATRRRPEAKTALQGLIPLEHNWRTDHPPRRGPFTPRPASRRGDALAINGLLCARHKSLGATKPLRGSVMGSLSRLGSRGGWLTKRAPDKPSINSPSDLTGDSPY